MGTRRRGSKKVNLRRAPGRAGTKCRGKKIREMLENELQLAHVEKHYHNGIPLIKPQRKNVVI